MARYNKIFAGPAHCTMPQVHELPAADGAIIPGNVIVVNSGEFQNAGAATVGKVFIAQDNYLTMKGTDDAYSAGDTVIGLELLSGEILNARLADGANVSKGTALTTAANGTLAIAGAGAMVVAVADEDFNNNTGSPELIHVRAPSGYTNA